MYFTDANRNLHSNNIQLMALCINENEDNSTVGSHRLTNLDYNVQIQYLLPSIYRT